MNENKWAIITVAVGGMGTEITRAVAKAGYRVIMACHNLRKAELIRRCLMEDTGNQNIEVIPIDLSSMRSVVDFACRVGTPDYHFVVDEQCRNDGNGLSCDGRRV